MLTNASKETIKAAVAAYRKLTEEEREFFRFAIYVDSVEPAAKRGRPPKVAPTTTEVTAPK